jgi:ferredoxin
MNVLIVGAGPAAVGAALGLVADSEVRVTILDVGARLGDANEHARERVAASDPAHWLPSDLGLIATPPVASDVRGLPEKRSFGSEYPFGDFGQLGGIFADGQVNRAVISGAYGGFSNVWGAQVMPFTSKTFEGWPVAAHVMYPHYAAVLREIPFAAEEDDLGELFPLLESSSPLPKLSERTEAVLARYAENRAAVRRRGVTVGRARLAFAADRCIRCGLCLTGCPYQLIYSAAQTLDRLRREGRVTYYGGLLALRVGESESGATVSARELRTGRVQSFDADRVLLACGGIGSSRLALTSLERFNTRVPVAESAQFMLPFASRIPVTSPLLTNDFTLNQFNIVVDVNGEGHDLSQLHFYTFDPAFINALPRPLARARLHGVRTALLRRISVALGYLPSWASPSFDLVLSAPRDAGSLAETRIESTPGSLRRHPMMRDVLTRLAAVAPRLDMWPLLPALQPSAPGKSYHWGAVFPHSERPSGQLASDIFGRVAPWERIHLVDASVFPNVPATTFTLTVMANAHRIARGIVEVLA